MHYFLLFASFFAALSCSFALKVSSSIRTVNPGQHLGSFSGFQRNTALFSSVEDDVETQQKASSREGQAPGEAKKKGGPGLLKGIEVERLKQGVAGLVDGVKKEVKELQHDAVHGAQHELAEPWHHAMHVDLDLKQELGRGVKALSKDTSVLAKDVKVELEVLEKNLKKDLSEITEEALKKEELRKAKENLDRIQERAKDAGRVQKQFRSGELEQVAWDVLRLVEDTVRDGAVLVNDLKAVNKVVSESLGNTTRVVERGFGNMTTNLQGDVDSVKQSVGQIGQKFLPGVAELALEAAKGKSKTKILVNMATAVGYRLLTDLDQSKKVDENQLGSWKYPYLWITKDEPSSAGAKPEPVVVSHELDMPNAERTMKEMQEAIYASIPAPIRNAEDFVAQYLTPAQQINFVLLSALALFAFNDVIMVNADVSRGWYMNEYLWQIPITNWKRYEENLMTNPIQTKTIIHMAFYMFGDWMAQIQWGRKNPLDFDMSRVLRNGAVGLVFGPLVHHYYLFADHLLPVHVEANRLWHAGMDQTVLLVMKTVAYLGLAGFVHGDSPKEIGTSIKDKTIPIVKKGWVFWPVVHAVSYGLIPARHRILWVTACDIVWSSILASLAHSAFSSHGPKKKEEIQPEACMFGVTQPSELPVNAASPPKA
uniref:Uncharacterized protein n=1 Tax=Fibrocapsa japonica TaxID=94617 RepID=A0A7S2XWE1_9STRA|mmetsp:Transcript_15770/g.23179  ORF Transcript_15770/g.23179 Transcript_15770/m.23179 type:complete len:653 (+) Transcript_15770:265-2223(+)